ncbi:hypothetical protein ACOACQ_21870 [Nocardioides sp. CPCC 206347]|uniref:hypothetical protein n=1 Tax=unclassified Nocardioides TaxID=2615069 RepID=UPI0036224629
MTTTDNAATRLAAALRSFSTPGGQTPESVRGFARGQNRLDAWRRHHESAELVATVDRILQGMELVGTDTSPFMAALPEWYAGVHFATLPWSSNNNRKDSPRDVCSDSSLKLLDALGLVIKTGGALVVTEDDRRRLTDVLAEARDLIDHDTVDLPDLIRGYLAELIRRAQMIVENLDKYGAETVRQVAFELGGAMAAQAERANAQQDEPRSRRWRSVATHLVAGFVGGTGGGVGEIAAMEAFKQLGGS